MDYMGDFIEAKYHLAVARRMMVTYGEFPEKRVLVGVISEMVKSVSRLIRSFLIYENVEGGWEVVLSRYLDGVTCENLRKILEVGRARKVSPVEFTRGNKIVFLIGGKYRVLTVDRIREFLKSVDIAVKVFSENFRQV